MFKLSTTLLTLPLAASIAVAIQDPQQPVPVDALRPVPSAPESMGQSMVPGLAPAASYHDADEWRIRLSDEDFAARASAHDEAVAVARHDDNLRRALQDWSTSEQESELAWTAYMILRESQRPAAGALGAPFLRMPGFDDLERRVLDMGFPMQLPFGEDLFDRWAPQGSGAESFESKGFSLEATPDGVKVRVEEEGPDGKDIREYEAESLDDLRASHPELFEGGALELGLGASPGLEAGALPTWPGLRRMPFPPLPEASVDRTDVLGVRVRPVTSPIPGLWVQSSVKGTIAAHLGLGPGDLIFEINDRRVHSVEDIGEVLGERAPDASVRLKWQDALGRQRTGTWSPQP